MIPQVQGLTVGRNSKSDGNRKQFIYSYCTRSWNTTLAFKSRAWMYAPMRHVPYWPTLLLKSAELGRGLICTLLALSGVWLLWAISFCRTSRIFSCRLGLLGKMSACAACETSRGVWVTTERTTHSTHNTLHNSPGSLKWLVATERNRALETAASRDYVFAPAFSGGPFLHHESYSYLASSEFSGIYNHHSRSSLDKRWETSYQTSYISFEGYCCYLWKIRHWNLDRKTWSLLI